MHRTTPSESNPFGFRIYSDEYEAMRWCMLRGVVFEWRLDLPWYVAKYKNFEVAADNNASLLVRQAREHLTALDNLRGTNVNRINH